MVKDIVFLVEGDTEKIIITHLNDTKWFEQYHLNIKAIIDIRGGGNLCPHNINQYLTEANTHNPNTIIILSDLECNPCIQQTKSRLGIYNNCKYIIAKKAIESWFLADTVLMKKITKNPDFYYDYPEATPQMPFDEIKDIMIQHTKRGIGPSKPLFAKKMIREGFDINNALQHQHITSLHYFINTLANI